MREHTFTVLGVKKLEDTFVLVCDICTCTLALCRHSI